MEYTLEYLREFVDPYNWDVQDYFDRLAHFGDLDTVELDGPNHFISYSARLYVAPRKSIRQKNRS